MCYFFKKIFFDTLNEIAIEIKWIIVAIIAAKIKSLTIADAIKKADIEGIVVKIAIIVPRTKKSSVPFLNAFITSFRKAGNKNQKYFIFG